VGVRNDVVHGQTAARAEPDGGGRKAGCKQTVSLGQHGGSWEVGRMRPSIAFRTGQFGKTPHGWLRPAAPASKDQSEMIVGERMTTIT
jgi:hypothetical protein